MHLFVQFGVNHLMVNIGMWNFTCEISHVEFLMVEKV